MTDHLGTTCGRLEAELTRWIGLDPGSIGASAVARALRLTRERLGCDDETILDRIGADPETRDRLIEEVVVSESWFFRDPATLEWAVSWVIARARGPETRPGFSRGPVRILCAPAAAGEEPRSIAMLLLEAGLDESSFRIDAFDVSRAAVRRAADGRYSANAFRDAGRLAADRFARWFHREGREHVLNDRVARLAPVAWGNLLAHDFVPPCRTYDLVCCRNLMIYLTPQARREMIRRLDAWLDADGLLVVGSAETSMLLDNFEPAADPSRFALRRIAAETRRNPAGPIAMPGPSRAVPAAPGGASPPSAPPPLPSPSPAVTRTDSGQPAGLEAAESLANERRYADAIRICREHLERQGPSARAFFLLGTIHRAGGSEAEAVDCFRKAVYLDPSHADAALALTLSRGARP